MLIKIISGGSVGSQHAQQGERISRELHIDRSVYLQEKRRAWCDLCTSRKRRILMMFFRVWRATATGWPLHDTKADKTLAEEDSRRLQKLEEVCIDVENTTPLCVHVFIPCTVVSSSRSCCNRKNERWEEGDKRGKKKELNFLRMREPAFISHGCCNS